MRDSRQVTAAALAALTVATFSASRSGVHAQGQREMLAWAALASASLPLRAASITRFTAATSFGEVAALGATANGPDAGRTSGLNSARLSNSAPCKPTLA